MKFSPVNSVVIMMLTLLSTSALSAGVESMTCRFDATRVSIIEPTMHQLDRIYLSKNSEESVEAFKLFISDGSTDFTELVCPQEASFTITDQSILLLSHNGESLPIGLVKSIGRTEYEVTYFHYISVDIGDFPFGIKIDFFY